MCVHGVLVVLVALWHIYFVNQSDLICSSACTFLSCAFNSYAHAHYDEKRTVLKISPPCPQKDDVCEPSSTSWSPQSVSCCVSQWSDTNMNVVNYMSQCRMPPPLPPPPLHQTAIGVHHPLQQLKTWSTRYKLETKRLHSDGERDKTSPLFSEQVDDSSGQSVVRWWLEFFFFLSVCSVVF